MTLAIAIFLLALALIVSERVHRTKIALAGATSRSAPGSSHAGARSWSCSPSPGRLRSSARSWTT